MSKIKELLGFRTKKDKVETPMENWDIYPTHVVISEGYWTVSTSGDEFNEGKNH